MDDMFAPSHHARGGYTLMQENLRPAMIYPCSEKRASISVAGPLHRIGWNAQYIIFTDATLRMRLAAALECDKDRNHQTFRISERQRRDDTVSNCIDLLSPSAWMKATR